jgi:penicillin-binding protein 2
LATNQPIFHLVWSGTERSALSREQGGLIESIEKICDVQIDKTLILSAERRGRTHPILHDVTQNQIMHIMVHFPNHPNITIKTEYKRMYPYNELASHIIGYLGKTDHRGKMGLERLLDNSLRGQPGIEKRINTSTGKTLQQQHVQRALMGEHITTTIDLDLQMHAEDVFHADYTGVFIVMNPQTGAIRSLVSRPSFDPNSFVSSIDTDMWQHFEENKVFLNRALMACYPPASLFKLVTICAALEEKIIDTSATWNCLGKLRFGGQLYRCNRLYGHGTMTLQEALAHSCNIPFYEIGKRISIDTLSAYAKKLGLGEKTRIILPERKGLMPTKEWKMEQLHEQWWQGETVIATIGQSYFSTTPIQIARMIGGFSTGYLVKPRILNDEVIERTALNISDETKTFIRNTMQLAVQEGTVRILKTFKDLDIRAKTGTAQVTHKSKRREGREFREHGWCTASIQSNEHEPLVTVVLIEHAGTSRPATRTTKRFIEKVFNA